MTIEITGLMAGHADRHTESSLAESFENAYFTAPWDIYEGPLKDFPKEKIRLEAEPLVLFAHGSSGIGEPLKAFGRWLRHRVSLPELLRAQGPHNLHFARFAR